MVKKERNHLGFTLIELVVVVLIIGVLIAFVIPGVGGAIERSHKASAMNSLREIAKAYKIYRQDNGDFIFKKNSEESTTEEGTTEGVGTIRDFALKLAQVGLLNDPNSYVFSWDSVATKVNKPKRDTIVMADGTTDSKCWSEVAGDNVFSVGVVVGLDESCPEDTTPLAYTRGLGTDGKWTKDGVFGTKGGFVVFLSGQVKWFEEAEFLEIADTGRATTDITDAIPDGAACLDS